MKTIGIVGSGTWGTALALTLNSNGHNVTVWSHNSSKAVELNKSHVHPNLKDIILPSDIVFTSDLEKTVKDKDFVFCAVPSTTVRTTFAKASEFISENQIIVSVSKGIEKDSLMTMTEVISDELAKHSKSNSLVALSGPTHAEEVVRKLPTTIVSACENLTTARHVKAILNNDYFKVFGTTDRKGTELCGALKNIIAIAAGLADGLGYGDNAKSALITRGMAEISFLGSKLGCHEHTFFGLAGIGDLIVTATSKHSRNHTFGYMLGQGLSVADAMARINMVVEGINVLPAAVELSQKYQVTLPIISSVNAVVNEGKTLSEVQNSLLSMPATREFRTLGRYSN